jgi:hypothetical protein
MPATFPRWVLFLAAFGSAALDWLVNSQGQITWAEAWPKLAFLLAGVALRFPGDVEKRGLPKEWQDALDGLSDIPDPKKVVSDTKP